MDFACIECGTIFKRYSTIGRLCGSCVRAKQGKKPLKARAASYGAVKPKQCKHCGKTYTPYRASTAHTSFYCSRDCSWKGRVTKEARKCRVCFKEFEFAPSQSKHYKNAGICCSRKCVYEYRIRKNANAPISDPYGRTSGKADKDWQAAVRERDGRLCQRCGVFEEHIHTHHIALRSQRPDLKHVVDNGICLCGSCHRWVHAHPKEAKVGGFISDERYGIKMLEQQAANISRAKDRGRHQVVKCTICGAEKTYNTSSLRNLSGTQYRCYECYRNHPIKRGWQGDEDVAA